MFPYYGLYCQIHTCPFSFYGLLSAAMISRLTPRFRKVKPATVEAKRHPPGVSEGESNLWQSACAEDH